MTAPQPFARDDVSFSSGDSTCAAWLYLPTGVTSPPVVISIGILNALFRQEE
jgi:uncharacterized protein